MTGNHHFDRDVPTPEPIMSLTLAILAGNLALTAVAAPLAWRVWRSQPQPEVQWVRAHRAR
jgi:hypothetical protein